MSSDDPSFSALSPDELRECMYYLYKWSTNLLVALRDSAPDIASVMTPEYVSWPLLLPAPDKALVERLTPELLALRHDSLEYVKAIREPDRSMAQVLADGRRVMKSVHGLSAVFFGEERTKDTGIDDNKTPDICNKVLGGRHDTVVQVGKARDVHIHESTGGELHDIQNPLVITLELRPRKYGGDLVVDANPPRAMAPTGTLYVVTVQARTTRAVIIHRARPVIISRRQPRRACYTKPVAGAVKPRLFTADFDFDGDSPQFHAEGEDFPFAVSATDPEQFWFMPVVSAQEVAWQLELDWTCLDHDGTVVVNDGGRPFEMYPLDLLTEEHTTLSWGCSGITSDKPDCPSRRLDGSPRNVFDAYRWRGMNVRRV